MACALALRREVARIYLTDSEGIGINVARDRRGLRDSDKNLQEEGGNLDHWYQVVVLAASCRAKKKGWSRNNKATRT